MLSPESKKLLADQFNALRKTAKLLHADAKTASKSEEQAADNLCSDLWRVRTRLLQMDVRDI